MCTTIAIKSDSGDVFWGRTMDFTFDPFKPSADSKMTTFPANYELKGLHQSWTTKYPLWVSTSMIHFSLMMV